MEGELCTTIPNALKIPSCLCACLCVSARRQECLLLQKWFRIPSDPELETQINDRISFKKFLACLRRQELPFDLSAQAGYAVS